MTGASRNSRHPWLRWLLEIVLWPTIFILLAAGTKHTGLSFLPFVWLITGAVFLWLEFMAFLYRMQLNTTGMPPARLGVFSPRSTGSYEVGRAMMPVGTQRGSPGPNRFYEIRLSKDELTLVGANISRLLVPLFVIPLAEIALVTTTEASTTIRLHDGTAIPLTRYKGPPLDEVIAGQMTKEESSRRFTVARARAAPLSTADKRTYAAFSVFVFAIVAIAAAWLGVAVQRSYSSGVIAGAALADPVTPSPRSRFASNHSQRPVDCCWCHCDARHQLQPWRL